MDRFMTTPATLLARLNTRRRVATFACAITTATLGVEFSLAGLPAHAAPAADLACAGARTTTYSPGITTTPRETTYTINGALTSCESPSDPTLISGTYSSTGKAILSCSLSSGSSVSYETYKFNNGESSTARYVSNVVTKPAGQTVVTSIGTVESGKFKGDMATRTATVVTQESTQCLSRDGVTSTTGPVTLTFTRPN